MAVRAIVDAVHKKPVGIGIAVPGIAGEGTVKPVRRVKGGAAAVAAHGVRRAGNTRDAPGKIIAVAVHAQGPIWRGILAMRRHPAIRMLPVGVYQA